MKVRFPLYAQILLWFFLNLALLGAASYAFFRLEFHLGLDSLLAGQAGERITRLANQITYEVGTASPSDRKKVLRRFNESYGVHFYLFRPDGGEVAGDEIILPGSVRARMADRTPRPGQPGPREGPPGNPGEEREFLPPGPGDGERDDFGPPPEQRARGDRPEGARPGSDGEVPSPADNRAPPPTRPDDAVKFMVRTTDPVRYWVGVRLPRGPRPESSPPWLLAVSETLSGGGLFFDFRPWLGIGAVALVISVLWWLPLVGGITGAVSQITRATEQVAGGNFGARVPAQRPDELGRLGEVINVMAARLSDFVRGQKRFLGDVAHELCSPLARMQVALGILEERAASSEQTYLADLRQEIEQVSSLVNELLSFSKAALGSSSLKLQPVQLRAVAEKAISREALDRESVRLEVDPELWAVAEPELLLRSLSNLLRNAIRYAGQAGPITLSARTDGEDVVCEVCDCGPGVPEAELTRIFDPFYRVDPSRDSATGGVGLGLSIVKTCVESCQGNISCRNREPSGLQVTLRLRGAPKPVPGTALPG